MKLCPRCGNPRHMTVSGRLATYCLNCEKEYSSAKRKRRQDKINASRRNPEYRKKHNAQNLAYKAHPISQQCEVEGCNELGQRHHDDYSKAHEIRWLCHQHHMELHR